MKGRRAATGAKGFDGGGPDALVGRIEELGNDLTYLLLSGEGCCGEKEFDTFFGVSLVELAFDFGRELFAFHFHYGRGSPFSDIFIQSPMRLHEVTEALTGDLLDGELSDALEGAFELFGEEPQFMLGMGVKQFSGGQHLELFVRIVEGEEGLLLSLFGGHLGENGESELAHLGEFGANECAEEEELLFGRDSLQLGSVV